MSSFPRDISYNMLCKEFKKTPNGSTCPREGYINGIHYISKCGAFQTLVGAKQTSSDQHVHNEFIADGLIRNFGFNVPESKEYKAKENNRIIRLSKFIEPTRPLVNVWFNGNKEEKMEIQKQVIEVYPLQHVIAGLDTFQNDNVLVTNDCKLWYVDNGASLGWRAQGGKNLWYWSRTDPKDPKYGFLSLRYHQSQTLLKSILSGVKDEVLWRKMSIFDKEKFLSCLPKEEGYKVENINGYIDALICEAKKYI
jgi:hypothetical protein